MDSRAIRAFVNRDWDAVAACKVAYWADRFRHEGWRASWDAADALLADVRQARPGYPDDKNRALDFAAHLTLRERFDRVADCSTSVTSAIF